MKTNTKISQLEYLDLRLALGQSWFTVEVSLHDDAAYAGAFRCENPQRALVSRGTARHV